MNKFASRIVLGARQLVAEVTASCAPWPMRDVRRFGQPCSLAFLLLLSLSLGATNVRATGHALSIPRLAVTPELCDTHGISDISNFRIPMAEKADVKAFRTMSAGSKLILRFVSMLASGVGSWTVPAEASEWAIELQGVLERRNILESESTGLKISDLRFTWYMDSRDRWMMTAKQTLHLPGFEGQVSTIQTGFNGQDIFSVHYADYRLADVETMQLEFAPDRRAASHPATVAPLHSHVGENMWTPALWFAFVAGRTFPGSPVSQVPPAHGGLNGRLQGYVYDLHYERGEESTNLISAARWIINPHHLDYAFLLSHPEVTAPETQEIANEAEEFLVTAKSRLPWHQVGATYETTSIRILNGVAYPATFMLEMLAADPANRTSRPVQKIHGTVTNANAVSTRLNTLPELQGLQSVKDYRFAAKLPDVARGYIQYGISNQTWIEDVSDPRLTIIAGGTPMHPIVLPNGQWAQVVPLFVLAVLILAAPVGVWFVGRHKRVMDQCRKTD
jgi:hypothetical protein